MIKFFILPYAVIFLKILGCLTQYTSYELGNSFESQESDEDISNDLVKPWFKLNDADFYDFIYNDDSYDEDEYHILNPILKRVRRRIFPGVGKALDRDRSDRKPWVRSRDGFDEEHGNSQVLRRDGPMGSEALYELYPHLTPSNWKERRNRYPGKSLSEEIYEEEQTEIVDDEPKFKIERDVGGRNVQQRRKPKVRMPKRLKEEIAIFAEQYGSSAAVAHFNNKVNFPLKKNAVEKFVRRYRRRMERQRKRRISRRS